jgi:hypothetical protein
MSPLKLEQSDTLNRKKNENETTKTGTITYNEQQQKFVVSDCSSLSGFILSLLLFIVSDCSSFNDFILGFIAVKCI